MTVVFSRRAAADLDAIWDYSFETWGVEQAEAYARRLRAAAEDASAPASAWPAPRPGLLRRRCGSHHIYLRQTSRGVLVVRILHERMDPGRHL